MWPHEQEYARKMGRSPGNGITPIPVTREPLATEGEATPGPDDVNPYEEREMNATLDENPTEGDDPFVFDDVAAELPDFGLPEPNTKPSLEFL